ncbi:hypothetical protein BH10CHL1_BH10CHL1_06270 [soil metagenome]
MSVLAQLFGSKYNDEQLVSTLENACAVDPLLPDPGALVVSSKKGVIQLAGKVRSASEKTRVESLIQSTLDTTHLKYAKIVNDITVA